MPTYYNGKEITSTSIMSGINLAGKSSITIGGKVITLSTPPPPEPPSVFVYGDSGGVAGYSDPGTACVFAGSGPPLKVFVKDVGGNFELYLNSSLTIPLSPGGWWWSDDPTNIGAGPSPEGSSILVDPRGSGLVVMISRC